MTSGFTRFFKSLFCAVQHYVNVRVVSYFESGYPSHLRVQRYGVFFILQIFSQLFLKVFCNALIMSEIFFKEKLGETRSEGGDGGLKVGKERVVHFFGGGINLLR